MGDPGETTVPTGIPGSRSLIDADQLSPGSPSAPEDTDPGASNSAPEAEPTRRNLLIVSAIVLVLLLGALTHHFLGAALGEIYDSSSALGSAARANGTRWRLGNPPHGYSSDAGGVGQRHLDG